ncbi:hypothetical protein ILUMI_11455 [Ignelater luminosus]|uniref:Uncharacterized protein n=1 Tax=Ignelater luminosus TaxID=2038154 RepID=A0A8K0GAH4_IGNLU|nr:hypothetical protein ILUMI_11455 [Ignelater luminosus]
MLKNLFGDKQLSKGIDPDEAVAIGAAIQAAMLTQSDIKTLVPKIIDVTPLSFGISEFGDLMCSIIKRNSQIPITQTVQFATVEDRQTVLHFDIYEGERSLVQHNTKIGYCSLRLMPEPSGYTAELSFHVNENGVLEVGAKAEDGVYASWTIKYEKRNIQTVADILRKAKLHKEVDTNINLGILDDPPANITLWISDLVICASFKQSLTILIHS